MKYLPICQIRIDQKPAVALVTLHGASHNVARLMKITLVSFLVLSCWILVEALDHFSLGQRWMLSRGGMLSLNITGGDRTDTSLETEDIKLMYFDARGAAEISRVLLKIGGLRFEDIRFSLQPKAEGKGFETPLFDIAKEDGSLSANMQRAPVMVVDGVTIGQSRAIEAYVAQKAGLFGSSLLERARIQNIVENVKDIKEKWGKCMFISDERGLIYYYTELSISILEIVHVK